MKMKKILACILAMVLLASAVPLAVMPVAAQGVVVPGDTDGDKIVSKDELASVIIPYMLGKEGHLGLDEVREVAHIHVYYPRTITDSADRTVTIYKPVEMIVMGTPSWMYDAVWILGAQDKVVGVTKDAKEKFAQMLPGIQDKQSIGSYRDPDFEVILSLEPDIVFGGKRYEEGLKDTGITVITMKFNEIEKVDSEFRILAKILGKEERVESYIAWKNGYIDQLKERTKGIEPKVRVYAEWSDVPLCTGSRGSGVHDVIELAGGINIAGDLPGSYPNVEPEWIAQQNPEVIIFPAFADFAPTDLTGYHIDIDSYENAKQFIEEARNRTELNRTDAVKNNRVYVLDGHYTESAVRSYIGAFYCAKLFYPEQCMDLEPEEINREYFEEWLGVPYKGIWAYPLFD